MAKTLKKTRPIVIHPKATSSAERAVQLKRKYKQLNQWTSLYKSLPTKLGGRLRLDPSYCKRVRTKAANMRNVQIMFNYQYIYHHVHECPHALLL